MREGEDATRGEQRKRRRAMRLHGASLRRVYAAAVRKRALRLRRGGKKQASPEGDEEGPIGAA